MRDYALAILKDSWLSHAETVDMISNIYYIQVNFVPKVEIVFNQTLFEHPIVGLKII